MAGFSSERELWIIETIWNILSTENSWNSWYHFVWQISTFMHFNSEIQKLFAANLKSQGCKWIYIFKNLFSQAPNINVHKTAVILIPLNSCNTAWLGHFNLFYLVWFYFYLWNLPFILWIPNIWFYETDKSEERSEPTVILTTIPGIFQSYPHELEWEIPFIHLLLLTFPLTDQRREKLYT